MLSHAHLGRGNIQALVTGVQRHKTLRLFFLHFVFLEGTELNLPLDRIQISRDNWKKEQTNERDRAVKKNISIYG